jgi:hypothetical protein
MFKKNSLIYHFETMAKTFVQFINIDVILQNASFN